MLIKCATEQPEQYMDSNSARVLKKIKLPTLFNNSIFTSRSVVKTIQQFQSANNVEEKEITNQQKRTARQFISCPRSQRNMSNSSKKLKQYSHYDKIKFRLKRRVQTETKQSNESPRKQHSLTACSSKLQIIQRILKMTQDLGFNRPDYKNYMKTHRTQPKYAFENQDEKFESMSPNKQQTQAITQPLHQIVTHSQSKKKASQTKYCKAQNEQMDEGNYTFNVMKCNIKNIKLKAKPNNYKKLITLKKPQIKKQEQMNKSIRGWTKYGKISQQIYN